MKLWKLLTVKQQKECFAFESGMYEYLENRTGKTPHIVQFSEKIAAERLGETLTPDHGKSIFLKMCEGDNSLERYRGTYMLRDVKGEDVLIRLLEMAQDPCAGVRKTAAGNLADYPDDSRVLHTLRALLKDEAMYVRETSAAALGWIKNPGTIADLRKEFKQWSRHGQLWQDESPNEIALYVLTLLKALLMCGEQSVIQDIQMFLKHPDSMVINMVLLILKSIEDKIPIDGIRPLLHYRAVNSQDFSSLIQLHAAEVLYKNGSSEGLQVLKKSMKSPDWLLRQEAANVLALYGGDEGRTLIKLFMKREKDSGNRIMMLGLLKPVPEELAMPILKEALAHQWPTARWDAALALKRLPATNAHALAEEALQDEPDPLVQKALKLALSQ